MGDVIGLRRLVPGDAEFPPLLREIPAPPRILHVVGRHIEPAPMVAVVGTRRPSRYGLEVGRAMAAGLAAAGVTVVSGLATGIDAAAHRGALEAGGITIAVLGNGLDVCYPWRNAALYDEIRKRGTLLSEYPEGTRPLRHHFPTRNRIIAGMALGVVIVEGREEGGAMITARLAGEMGREVFAVPGPVHAPESAGPLALIRDGARTVTSPEDVLEDLGLRASSSRSPETSYELGPDEQRVLGALAAEPAVLDAIANAVAMPVSAAAAVLARLELAGLAGRHPGGRFARTVGSAGCIL
ncbi:MAG: DNA-processing protein DprA [Actinomycetota bacterium]